MKPALLFLGICALFSNFAHAGEPPADGILDQKDFDPNTPYYQKIPPGWAAGIRLSFSSFPLSSSVGMIDEFYFEKLLHFQLLGIFSVGAHIGLVPLNINRWDNWKWGGEVRYQLRFMRNQIIVPTAAVVYDTYELKNAGNTVDALTTPTFLIGAMINLNFFDAVTAGEAYDSLGLLRSYLTIEVTPIGFQYDSVDNNGNNMATNGWYDGTNVHGMIWYMGLRLEFE